MNREDIYVPIDSEKKRLDAIQILESLSEQIFYGSKLLRVYQKTIFLCYNIYGEAWIVEFEKDKVKTKTEITVTKLRSLLTRLKEKEAKQKLFELDKMESNLEPTQKSKPFYMVFVENSSSLPIVKHEMYPDAHGEMLRLSKKEGKKAYVLLAVSEVEQVPKITSLIEGELYF